MKRTRLTFLAVLLAIAASLLASCQGPTAPVTPPTPDTTTVAEVLSAEGFTTLASAVTAAGLGDTLAGTGPFTIFAPTNEAFAALEPGLLDSLLADTDLLSEVLSYHVLPEEANAAALTPGFRTTVQGGPVAVTRIGEGGTTVALNNLAFVSEADIDADNGVVHAVDAVLLLPETEFAALLEGGNEVPPVESDATGSLTATLEGTTLTIAGTYEGLSVVETPGAHIHGPAETTQNADVLFPLTFDNAAGTLATTVDLAAPENAAFGPAAFGYLQGGQLYANLHTAENPSGEIRGQLLLADQVVLEPDFTADLSGGEEEPPVETDATGELEAALDDANTTLTVVGTYTGLSGPPTPPGTEASAAHIHVAPRGENGPIVAPLTVTPNADDPTSGTFGGQVPIGTGPGQLPLEALEGFGAYVNIHTEANPGGEIRGQLSDVRPEVPAPTP